MLTIPQNTLEWAQMTERELLEDIAVMLYQSGKLTFGQASKTAQLSYTEFQFLLGRKQVPINYGVRELMEDVETLNRIKAQNGHR